ncbi:MAG: hypothetical protein Q9204_001358 [Flavoplaca sp. TL-2023a]
MSLSRTLHLLPRSTIVARHSFSTTAPAFVKAGDPVPDIDLVEGSPGNKIRFLGDPDAKFTEALDLSFESASIFGNNRSKRYALKVENGKVKEAFVEPDNTGVDVSTADKVLH